MRIYNDAREMVREVERDLFEMGIRVQPATMQDKDVHDDVNYETLEVQAYGYTLTRLDKLAEMIEYMKGSLPWADAELQDRLSEAYINPGSTHELLPVWSQFLRDGRFSYTYNERFREQLPRLIEELRLRPNTRQAIITMYDRHQDIHNWGGIDRVPCSMHYQLYVRGDRLNMVYVMRSCDFLTHFAHDVYLACGLLQHVADALGVKVGHFTHFIGSLHAYRKDMAERGIF